MKLILLSIILSASTVFKECGHHNYNAVAIVADSPDDSIVVNIKHYKSSIFYSDTTVILIK